MAYTRIAITARVVYCRLHTTQASTAIIITSRQNHRTMNKARTRRATAEYTLNPLMGTLKLQINAPLYSNTVLGTLAVGGWAVAFGTARKGVGGLRARSVPSSLYPM